MDCEEEGGCMERLEDEEYAAQTVNYDYRSFQLSTQGMMCGWGSGGGVFVLGERRETRALALRILISSN
jgi:hypothetical protein